MDAITSKGSTHLQVVDRLQHLIDEALVDIRTTAADLPFALLDFPDHQNVGDSAIWLGETQWLRDNLGSRPSYVCRQTADWSALDDAVPAGTIFLHGGGNFGDIWPAHQQFREAVLERYKGRPVVQLPQSIHYGDETAIEQTARAIAAHGNFKLLVRDHYSFDLARKHFDCAVILCPDMAFCIGGTERPAQPDIDVLMLMRTDVESRMVPIQGENLPSGWRMDDWLTESEDTIANVLRKTRWGALLSMKPSEMKAMAREARNLENLADVRVKRGMTMLASARFVVTDRLHVHILSTLLGIPHVCLDNSYGKIRRFSEAFGTMWDGAYQTESLSEAMAIAADHTANRHNAREKQLS